jgi:hypothetical protein
MPLPDEVVERITRVADAIRAICERERLDFVFVVEPKDVKTGLLILTNNDRETDDAIRDTREMLAAAVRRMEGQHFDVVKMPAGEKPGVQS